MVKILTDAFEKRYRRKDVNIDVNIVGILFTRPESVFAQEEIIPHMDYWNHRSADDTDFFCPGYFSRNCYGDAKPILTVDDKQWFFSNHALTKFLKELESKTSWRYSGGCDLLVTNARYALREHEPVEMRMAAFLDLDSAVVFDLEELHKDEASRGVTRLADALFESARNINESDHDPCRTFSNAQGVRIAKGALKEMLLAYLPAWIKPEARKAFHYAMKDISCSDQ